MQADTATPKRARQIVRRLSQLYPDAHCALVHETPLQLLVATILSAQCTDVRVNKVTPALFARFTSPEAYATADPRELETAIASTGFFRNKSRNLMACCQTMLDKFDGAV